MEERREVRGWRERKEGWESEEGKCGKERWIKDEGDLLREEI